MLFSQLKHLFLPNMIWFSSDEKYFCQDQMVNSQNYQWISLSPQDVPTEMKTKHLVHIMVSGEVTCDGDVMPPFIFQQHHKLNREAYIK